LRDRTEDDADIESWERKLGIAAVKMDEWSGGWTSLVKTVNISQNGQRLVVTTERGTRDARRYRKVSESGSCKAQYASTLLQWTTASCFLFSILITTTLLPNWRLCNSFRCDLLSTVRRYTTLAHYSTAYERILNQTITDFSSADTASEGSLISCIPCGIEMKALMLTFVSGGIFAQVCSLRG